MAGRLYTVSWDAATSITVQIDVFELVPADDKPIFLEELTMWQTSDFGDAQDEVIGIQIIRGFTTSGSGGATATVGKFDSPGGTAISGTQECRNTTLATTGTTDILHEDGWNVRAPYIWTPPSDDWRPYCTQAQTGLYVRLLAAPVDAITMNASCKIREMG
jgi:hypothetical protein